MALQKLKQHHKSLNYLNTFSDSDPYMIYKHYLYGELLLYKGDFKNAQQSYNYFITHYKGHNFVKDAYYKLCLSYWMQDKLTDARFFIKKGIESGTSITEADKYAQRFFLERKFPNKHLMQARLFYDGGYYQQADKVLSKFSDKDFSESRDKLAYFYQKGRIRQAQNQIDSAIYYYKTTIQLGKQMPYYYAANAALQLGYIFLNRKHKNKASFYFQQALRSPTHEYKHSIDQKAKIALNRLEDNK